MPSSNRRFSEYLPTGYNDSFLFEPVLAEEIELELMLIPSDKAYGLYSCPTCFNTKVLKNTLLLDHLQQTDFDKLIRAKRSLSL